VRDFTKRSRDRERKLNKEVDSALKRLLDIGSKMPLDLHVHRRYKKRQRFKKGITLPLNFLLMER
jgi:hypothetical protein